MDDAALAPEYIIEEITQPNFYPQHPTDNTLDIASMVCHCLAAVDQRLTEVIEQLSEASAISMKLDELNRQLETMALTDPLTGLANRRLFADRYGVKLAEAERGEALAVFIIDIDNFKEYNDTCGHLAGDQALKLVSNALSEVVRRVDCLARYGGEEFVVLSQVNEENARLIASKLLAAVRQTKSGLTISIGIATYMPNDTEETLLKRADVGLYRAKRCGKDRACTFDDH